MAEGKSPIPLIGENTLVPIGLVASLGGLVFWLGTIGAKLENTVHAQEMMRDDFGKHEVLDRTVDEKLSAIDAKVSFIYDYARDLRDREDKSAAARRAAHRP